MNAQTLVNRLTYGAAAIAAVFVLVLCDAFISDRVIERRWVGWWADLALRGSLIPVAFLALSIGGSIELCRLMRMAGLRPQAAWAIFWSGLLTVSPWLISGLVMRLDGSDLDGYQWLLALLACAVAGSACGAIARREMTGALADMGATWAIILYTGLLPAFAVQLRSHSYLNGPEGAWLVLIFVFVVKVSDIGAWTTGLLIGRHKLIPWVSPKKTVEGALGGVACSALVALLFWQAHTWTDSGMSAPASQPAAAVTTQMGSEEMTLRSHALIHEITEKFARLERWQAIVFGLLMSICGQIGDLLESCFKRSAGAKDSAALLPSFGGVLDIIDSPLLAAPVAWFLLTCWWQVI